MNKNPSNRSQPKSGNDTLFLGSFKYLFGTERNKGNLIGFLNLILEAELESSIVDLEYLNNESIPLDAEGSEWNYDIDTQYEALI